MEPPLSPRSSDDCPFDVDDEQMMERQGFCWVNSVPIAGDSLLRHFPLGEIEADRLSRSHLTDFQISTDDQKAWQLIEADFNISALVLLPHFESTEQVIRQGPIIHNMVLSPSQPSPLRAHPCPGGFSIWRPVLGNLGPEDGLFKVYPGSHHIRTEEELRHSKIDAVELRIRADQILIVHGGLWIEQGGGGSGLLMWIGVSTEIVGLHVDKYSLDFVALAYGAEMFLTRDRSLGMMSPEAIPLSHLFQERNTRSNSRSETAKNVLTLALSTLQATEASLKRLSDPTRLILKSDYGIHQDDPRIEYATVRSTDLKRYFLHAVTLRYLSGRSRETPDETVAHFIRKEGLPEKHSVTHAVQNGRKMLFLEAESNEPGLWLVFMGLLPRFQFMSVSELRLIPELLRGQYEKVLEAGQKWSRYMVRSSQLYEIWMGELIQGRNPT